MDALKKIFTGTYVRSFVSLYLAFTLVGAIILYLPISQQAGQSLSFIDALFVSVSGMSTTGLSTVVVADVLNRFGQTVLAFIIQFGGIGLVMLIGFFWIASGKLINLSERRFIQTDQNQVKTSDMVRLVKNILVILFIIESIMFVIMSSYLYLSGYFGLGDSIYQAFFLVISLTANAGFDITGDSLFRYNNDYIFQSMAMFLMFVGAVGFWPLMELKDKYFPPIDKETGEKKQFKGFSLYTKLIVTLHISLWLFGAMIFFGLEAEGFLEGKSLIESIYYSLFMSLTTRNAGFATMDVNNLTQGTLLLFSGLMFIGSSPNSAGGGIRTSTFFLVLAAIIAFSQQRKQVALRKTGIKQETVYKSIIVFNVAIMVVFLASFGILIFDEVTFTQSLFEVASAFGTTGLSLGITASLSSVSKFILIVTMFIGRVGIVAWLLIFSENTDKNRIRYPETDIIVG